MNKFFISLITFSFLFVAKLSQASDYNLEPLPHMMKATVVSVDVDPKAEFFSPDFVSGLLQINFAEQSLVLSLNKKMNCRDQFCLTVMPAPVALEFMLIDFQVDDCGVVTYTAKNSTDEQGYVVTVKDKQQNSCHTPAELTFATEISIVTQSISQQKSSQSKFGGRVLVSIQ